MDKLLRFEEEKISSDRFQGRVKELLDKEEELIAEMKGLSGDSIQSQFLGIKAKQLKSECDMLLSATEAESANYGEAAFYTLSQLKDRLDRMDTVLSAASDKLSMAEDLKDKAKEISALQSFKEALSE